MNNSLKLSALFALCFALVFTACKEDDLLTEEDATGEGAQITGVIGGNPSGETLITSNRTLSGNVLVRGLVTVTNGATLTIRPGTNLIAELAGQNPAGLPGTIVITRNSRIIANGTPNDPIVFTSRRSSNKQPGDVGGLLILGRAYANVAQGVNGAPQNNVGQIEGIPPQFNQEPYRYGAGQSDPNVNRFDNSGSIRYFRIEYAGNFLVEGNETNGLTLGGVGEGTTIDHIQITRGRDDAFEWFGGTVNAKYLFAFSNVDDDFDTDQGFQGKVQYAVGVKNGDLTERFNAISGLESRGFESNGDDSDAAQTNPANYTNPTFANVTLIGPMTPFKFCATIPQGFDNGVVVRDESRLDLYNSRILAFPENQYFIEQVPNFAVGAGAAATTAKARGNFASRPNIASSSEANVSNWRPANSGGRGVSCFEACDPNGSVQNVLVTGGLRCAAGFLPFVGSQRPNYVPFTKLSGQVRGGTELNDPFFDGVDFTGAFSTDPARNAMWNFDEAWIEFTPEDNVYF